MLSLAQLAVVLLFFVLVRVWWRTRLSFGKKQGLPPGSLGLVSSFRALRAYDFYREQAAKLGPVFKAGQHHRSVACIIGLGRTREALQRHRAELSPAPLPINRYTSGGLLRYMTSERHQAYREQLRLCMSTPVLRACEPFVAEQAQRIFAEMARRCLDDSANGVGLQPYVNRFVFPVCAKIFLGSEPGDELCGRLPQIYRDIDHRLPWLRPAKTRRRLAELVGIVQRQAEHLGDGSHPRCFLGEALRTEPYAIQDPVFVENLAYFLHIARSDLEGLVGWLVKMVADHPQWAERVREDASVADRFVAETLRLRQSEYIYRRTTGSIQVDGFMIPSGWLVRFCVRESHVDAAVFKDPLDFDPDRFLRSYSQDEYQPFGMNEHSCLGTAMTRIVSRVCVETLVRDYDCSVVSDGPMELGLQHHRHWRPSSQFRLRLVARVSRPEPDASPLRANY